MRVGAFAYILAVLVLSGPNVSFGCPKQIALSVALDSERALLAELRSDLQTLPETQQHRRPEIRRRIRETRSRVQDLSVLLRKQAVADLAVQASEDRQIDLGYRAEALVEARAWAIRDFRWEERHSS